MGFTWTHQRVREALDLAEGAPGPEGAVVYSGISTDTRTLEPGALLVALKGPHFDAHDFVASALEAGAGAAVVERPIPGVDRRRLYRVDDTLVALGRLAAHRRRGLPARVVGITGSLGKTTTKELVRGALEGTLKVHVTPANLNNRVGVPLTLLSAPADSEVLVVEMGVSEPGEMAALARIVQPDLGIITTVAESHLLGLGSLEGVLLEKLAILEGMDPHAPVLVGDQPAELARRVRRAGHPVRVVGWGSDADADRRPIHPEMDAQGRIRFRWQGLEVRPRIAGRHGVQCALFALEVARLQGVPAEAAVRGVNQVSPPPLRGEYLQLGSLSLILDCYNAGPESVREAAAILAAHSGRTRVAFLGTMRELGELEALRHAEVLEAVLASGVERVVATGAFATAALERLSRSDEAQRILAEDEPEVAYDRLKDLLRGDEVVLLKASRGVRLERLLPRFQSDFAPAPQRRTG